MSMLPVRVLAVAVLALAATGAAAAEPAVASDGLWAPALRTLASLALVLAVLGGCAWLARRLRQGGPFRAGLIEVVSGISLGGREKVVLLRVGGEQVLVGISPAGMRALHVLKDGAVPESFSKYMEKSQ